MASVSSHIENSDAMQEQTGAAVIADPVEKNHRAAEGALCTSRSCMKKLEGLSRTVKSKKTNEQLSQGEKEKRAATILKTLAEKHEVSKEKQLLFDYVSFVQDVVTTLALHPVELRTDQLNGHLLTPSWDGERAYEVDEYKELLAGHVDTFIQRQPKIAQSIIKGEEIFLESVVHRELKSELDRLGLGKVPQTNEQLLQLKNTFVSLLIKGKLYDSAENQIDLALSDDFAPFVRQEYAVHFKANRISREMSEAGDQADEEVAEHIKDWRKQGMTESQITIERELLVRNNYEKNVRHNIAARYNLPVAGAKAELFRQYVEMLNPRGNMSTPSARRKDQLKSIALRNLPLVLFSGGTAVFAEKALASVIERLIAGQARKYLLTTGSELAGGMLLEGTVVAQGASAEAIVALRFARIVKKISKLKANSVVNWVSSVSLEQSVGSIVYRALGDEWYETPMAFVSDLLIGLAGRGLFQAGGVALKAPTKTVISCLRKVKEAIPLVRDVHMRELLWKLHLTNNDPAIIAVLFEAEKRGMLEGMPPLISSSIRGQLIDAVIDLGDSLRIDASASSGVFTH